MTRYDPNWVRSFYDEYGEKEWDRWERNAVEQVKLHVHQHYLRQALRSCRRVLEVGAGAGRFTKEIADAGARVTVADISPGQLKLNRRKAAELGFADAIEAWVECDVCDMTPRFGDAEFDAVVCFGGPVSYVFERRDDALRELLRVLRPGGPLLVSVMGLWGSLHEYLGGVLAVSPEANAHIISTGDLTPELAPGSHRCHLFRAAELRACLEAAGAQVEAMSASNAVTTRWADRLEDVRQRPEEWQFLLDTEVAACREPGCLDVGTHIIALCRRPQ